MKTVIAIIVLLIPAVGSVAQAPPVQWQRSLGGSMAEELFDVQQTVDGGYVMTGYATSTNGDVSQALGEEDLWVVKLDPGGVLEWQRSYGGSASDQGRSIRQTSDGGYIVAGTTWSLGGDVTMNHGDGDLWVVRLADNGDLLWQRSLGGPLRESGGYVAVSASGEYFVAGSSKSSSGDLSGNQGDFDIWIVKLAANGDLLWENSFGGSAEDWAMGISSTTDGGVIVSGYTYSVNGDVTDNQGWSDAWSIKLDAGGDLDWQRTHGGTMYDGAFDIRQTTDGGYIMAASSMSNDGDLTSNNGGWDMWVVKLDGSGDIQWQTSFGGTSIDIAASVSQTADGGYIVAGHAASSNGNFPVNQGNEDTWLLRLDPLGTLLWTRSFGGSGYDWAAAVQQTSDGGYVLGVTTSSANGDVLFNNGFTDCLVVKFADSDLPTGMGSFGEGDDLRLFPNPGHDHLTLELELKGSSRLGLRLYDGTGQELLNVMDERRAAGPHRIIVPVQDLPPGIYLVRLRIDDRTVDRKWVKM